MPPPLETERLLLRPFVPDDIDDAFEALEGHSDVWKHDPGFQRSKAERAAILQKYAADNDPEGCGTLAVVHKQSGAVCGYVGLQLYILPREPLATPEVELYYKLGRPYWGRGYASEACWAMLRFAFDTLRLSRIVTITAENNRESVLLLQRLGMRVERAPQAWKGMLMGTLQNDRVSPDDAG